jgi:hypothetical protein
MLLNDNRAAAVVAVEVHSSASAWGFVKHSRGVAAAVAAVCLLSSNRAAAVAVHVKYASQVLPLMKPVLSACVQTRCFKQLPTLCSHYVYVLFSFCTCGQVRAAEEAQKIRRHASWIAKQVAGFWKKAERVVNYKVGAGSG